MQVIGPTERAAGWDYLIWLVFHSTNVPTLTVD